MKLLARKSRILLFAVVSATILPIMLSESVFAQSTPGEVSELLKMARKEFSSLNAAEVKFFESAAMGKVAIYKEGGKRLPDNQRTIRSNRIQWLLETRPAIALVPTQNSVVGASNAIIQHQIRVQNADLPFSLSFTSSEFRTLEITNSKIKSLYLSSAKGNYLTVTGTKVDGYTYLSDAEFQSVNFVDTSFSREMSMARCKVTRGANLSRTQLSKNLFLRGAEITVLTLDHAQIDGLLQMQDAKFAVSTENSLLAPKSREAISAKSLSVGRDIEFSTETKIVGIANFENLKTVSVRMTGDANKMMSVKGAFKLNDANIDNKLDLRFTHFESPGSDSILGDRLKVGSDILLNNIHSEGELRLIAASIGGDLSLADSKLENPGKTSLLANRIQLNGLLNLQNVVSNGRIGMSSASIGSQAIFANAKLNNPDGVALQARGAKTGADFILSSGFEAKGLVKLSNVTASQVWLQDGVFSNPGNVAIDLVGIETHFIDGHRVKCHGELKIISGKIGQLALTGEFNNPQGYAITAVNSEFNNGVILKDGFSARGSVRFSENKIKPYIRCEDARFHFESKSPLENGSEALSIAQSVVEGRVEIRNTLIEGELNLASIQIDGPLVIKSMKNPGSAVWDLRNAEALTLNDDHQSWPSVGNLYVHGFKYKNISDASPRDAESRLDWLNRVDADHFTAEPYEHLAEVLRTSGRQDDATTVLIEKANKQGSRTSFFSGQGFWYRILGPLIGYGYQPWRAFWIGIVIILVGWIVFTIGEKFRIVTPAKEAEHVFESEEHRLSGDYPVFEGLMYSIDVFVPLLDLHQAQYWMPSAKRGRVLFKTKLGEFRTGRLLRTYLWFQIFAGWTLTTLLVSALSGMLRL